MSTVSETAPRKPWSFRRRFAVQLVLMVLLLAIALPNAPQVVSAKLASAQLHGPDWRAVAGLSLAVKLHILGALGALILGSVLMWARKGRRFHRIAGWVWVSFAAVVAGSSIFIRDMNAGAFSLLHVFTAVTLISLPLGVMWARRHKVAAHRGSMMGLFFGGFAVNMFIAFLPGRTMWNMFFG